MKWSKEFIGKEKKQKQNQTNQHQTTLLSYPKKLHLPSLDKMWKGLGINMGTELFVLSFTEENGI